MRAFTRRSARRREPAARLRGWRWRRNPLRRGTDVAEAWLGVVTAVLFCLVPLAGWWSGQAVDRTLHRVSRAERSQRTLVTATVVPAAAVPGAKAEAAGTHGAHGSGGDTVLRWTAPDRTVHTAPVSADSRISRGDAIGLWTDRHGAVVPPPLDPAAATLHGVLAGAATGIVAAGLLLISRQIVLWRLMVRRLASWEREWARVGQDWGRAGTGG